MDKAVFDEKAAGYDNEFSNTLVGKTQRKIIHQFLEEALKNSSELNILEINCGTGDDVPFLKNYGKVTATDVSQSMLDIAKQKNQNVNFNIMDLNDPIPQNEKYDLIYSNFGGLNCISKERLSQLDKEFATVLNPGGQLVIVLISKWSLVEFIYFSVRLNFKKALRRIKGVGYFNGTPIYYYSQKNVAKMFESFKLFSKIGVGKFLTGEYMNKWAPRLKVNETKACSPNQLFGADHILLNFKRE